MSRNIRQLSWQPSLQVHDGLCRQDESVVEDVEDGDHHQHRRGRLGGELPLTGQHYEHHQVDQGSYHADNKTGISTKERIRVIRHY